MLRTRARHGSLVFTAFFVIVLVLLSESGCNLHAVRWEEFGAKACVRKGKDLFDATHPSPPDYTHASASLP